MKKIVLKYREDEAVADEIKKVAESKGMTVSEFIRDIVRKEIKCDTKPPVKAKSVTQKPKVVSQKTTPDQD